MVRACAALDLQPLAAGRRGGDPVSESIFTDHHRACMDAAVASLDKAFDGYIIIAMATDMDQRHEQVASRRKGGYCQALGLMEEYRMSEYAKHAADEIADRVGDE